MGSLLDEVAGGVGCGQRLASRASRGRFGDISIRFGCCYAAESEGRQEEEQHEQRVGILEDCEDMMDGGSMLPARLTVVQVAVQQLGGHDVTALHGARSCARLSVVQRY